MKKLIILITAITLFIVSTFNPAYGQWKKKAKKTITTEDTSGKKVVIPVEEPAEKLPIDKNASLTLADVVARLEKMEQRQKSSEKNISSLKKEVKAGKMSILDSMIKLRNESKKSSSDLMFNISNLSDKLKSELASNATFMMNLEAKADSGSSDAQQALAELREINSGSHSQKLFNWILFFVVLALAVFTFLIWYQKRKMARTLNNIINKRDPNHIDFRGNSRNVYGDKEGSTGPTNQHARVDA